VCVVGVCVCGVCVRGVCGVCMRGVCVVCLYVCIGVQVLQLCVCV